MGRCNTPEENIENLLHVKQMHYPEQPVDSDLLLDEIASPSDISFESMFIERMQFLVMSGMSDRVEALALKVWRNDILNMIQTAAFQWRRDNSGILQSEQKLSILKTNTQS